MSLISSNWPLRIVCSAGLLLWMPEQSAADVAPKKASDMVSLRTTSTPPNTTSTLAYGQGDLAPDK